MYVRVCVRVYGYLRRVVELAVSFFNNTAQAAGFYFGAAAFQNIRSTFLVFRKYEVSIGRCLRKAFADDSADVAPYF